MTKYTVFYSNGIVVKANVTSFDNHMVAAIELTPFSFRGIVKVVRNHDGSIKYILRNGIHKDHVLSADVDKVVIATFDGKLASTDLSMTVNTQVVILYDEYISMALPHKKMSLTDRLGFTFTIGENGIVETDSPSGIPSRIKWSDLVEADGNLYASTNYFTDCLLRDLGNVD